MSLFSLPCMADRNLYRNMGDHVLFITSYGTSDLSPTRIDGILGRKGNNAEKHRKTSEVRSLTDIFHTASR